MRQHAANGRELDEGFTRARKPFMIATEPTPSHDPGDAALDNPALGQGQEPFGEELVPLNLLPLGDEQAAFGFLEPFDGLQQPAQMDLNPDAKLAPIVTVAPDQPETGQQSFEGQEQGRASLPIGAVGCGHFDGQQMPLSIDQEVSFAPANLLASIIAFLRSTNGTGFDRLAIDDGCRWLRVSALPPPHLHTQAYQHFIQDARLLPLTEIVVDGLPGR